MAEGERRLPRFAPAAVVSEKLPDGGMILRSPQALGACARAVGDKLAGWASWMPHRVFLAEREGEGWRRVTYGEALEAARAIGQALLDRQLGPERPVMILSDNGIDHALLALGAMYVGVPVAPVSVAYSLRLAGFRQAALGRRQLTPGLIFADDGDALWRGARGHQGPGAAVAVSRNPPPGMRRHLDRRRCARRGRARRSTTPSTASGPDTVAKILFTSGSTGDAQGRHQHAAHDVLEPGGAARRLGRFLADRPPVVVDWLPWSHTFGGNHNFNMVLCNGGTLWIDDGKPAPGLDRAHRRQSARACRRRSISTCRAAMRCCSILSSATRRWRAASSPSSTCCCYAGAALPQSLWRAARGGCAARATGRQLPFVSAWGTTETAPCVDHRPLSDGARRQYRPAGARHRDQARARRRPARDPRARAQRHAGLLAPARPHRGRVRRGRLLPPRRRGAARGSGRPERAASSSTAASARTSSSLSGTWV